MTYPRGECFTMIYGKTAFIAALAGGAGYFFMCASAQAGLFQAGNKDDVTVAPLIIEAQYSVPDAADPQYPDAEEKPDAEAAAESPDAEDVKETTEADEGTETQAETKAKTEIQTEEKAVIEDAAEEAAEDAVDQKPEDAADAKAEDAENDETAGDEQTDKNEAAVEDATQEKEEEQKAEVKLDPNSLAGCQKLINELLSGRPIEFLSGRFTMSAKGREKVGIIAGYVKNCPETKILVSGHTDSDGTEAANQRLSGQRAEQVMELLIKLGVDKKRLRAVGHGQSQPLVENDTPKNKALNRRIEIELY